MTGCSQVFRRHYWLQLLIELARRAGQALWADRPRLLESATKCSCRPLWDGAPTDTPAAPNSMPTNRPARPKCEYSFTVLNGVGLIWACWTGVRIFFAIADCCQWRSKNPQSQSCLLYIRWKSSRLIMTCHVSNRLGKANREVAKVVCDKYWRQQWTSSVRYRYKT